MNYKEELELNGYVIIPGVLTTSEVTECYESFTKWFASIPNLDVFHNKINPHGILKYHAIGHQRHAWLCRINSKVQDPFRQLWNTNDLVVSFDGSCYIPKDCAKKDRIWTHTDQASNKKGVHCYQGFVALTSNKQRTLVVYEGSHLLHESYFEDNGISNGKDWNLISHDYLKEIEDTRRVLDVPSGALVLWDSRTFHQNQYGDANSEERVVQYVSYMPKNHPKNSPTMTQKRLKYLNEYRTTTHWACPIRVNSLQPRTYGNPEHLIDYSTLLNPELEDLMPDINKII